MIYWHACYIYHGLDADQFGFHTPDKVFVIIEHECIEYDLHVNRICT